MLLEKVRQTLEPLEYPRTEQGVVEFFDVLYSIVTCINSKNCSSYGISGRQFCVYENALDLLCKYTIERKFEYIAQCVSEIYDITQNYGDTNHEVSFGELCMLNTVLKLYMNFNCLVKESKSDIRE